MNNLEELEQDVMIAEDDKDDFEVLCDVIKSLDLKVVITRAENGDILMKLMNEKIPDILFLDIILPVKDGRTCIREIRGDSKFDHMPIIVYTSLKDLETIEFCYRYGTNLYVHKPATYTEIIDVVQKIFAVNWKKMRYYPTRAEFVLNPDVR